jgi:hypothetical protein
VQFGLQLSDHFVHDLVEQNYSLWTQGVTAHLENFPCEYSKNVSIQNSQAPTAKPNLTQSRWC